MKLLMCSKFKEIFNLIRLYGLPNFTRLDDVKERQKIFNISQRT